MPNAKPKYAAELEHGYDGNRPLRTLVFLLGLPWWEHLRLLFLHSMKMTPLLLLPVIIAESIRVANGDFADPWAYLRYLYLAYAVLLLANIPLHIWFTRGASGATRRMERRLRAALVRRLQHLSMRYHSETESGRLQTKVLRDVEELVRLAQQGFNVGLGAVVSIVYAFALTLIQAPVVTLGYAIGAPLAIGLVHFFRRSMRRQNDNLRGQMEQMNQRVNEMIDMVPITRAHGLEHVEMETIDAELEQVREKGWRVDLVNALFGSSAFVVFIGSVLGVIVFVTWMVLEGTFTVDKIALYASLFQMVIGSLQQIIGIMPQLSKGLASVRSIGEVLQCPDLEANTGKAAVTEVRGAIDFREVSFTYPTQQDPAVVDFNLNVPPGRCVAFVGASGSGKSTLMQLAIGFLRPQGGQILLDGRAMESLDMRTWRRHIAMVPQNTILFSGTIRDNVRYGLEGFDDDAIWAALEAANLDATIRELPQGLDTRVGENAVRLSGGQRQRLAIARAIIRNPRVIILDEATSALDLTSEHKVQQAIEALIQGRTTFIVAHRLSTIRQADHVVVMEQGRIVEQGTLAELEANDGPYRKLKALQD